MRYGVRNRAPFWATLVLTVGTSVRVDADTVIRHEVRYSWKRGVEEQTVESQRYLLSKTRARLDQGLESYLVDTELGAFYYLDLEAESFDTHPSPWRLEAAVPDELREQARKQLARTMPQTIRVTRSGRTDRIGGYEVEHVRIDAGGPEEPLSARFDLWVSSDLWRKLAGTAYWALESDRLSTSPYTAWLVAPLRELEGFPVKTEVVMELEGGRLRSEYVRLLTAVEEAVEVPESAYRVPEGFTPFPK
jgi:hypothetical protein